MEVEVDFAVVVEFVVATASMSSLSSLLSLSLSDVVLLVDVLAVVEVLDVVAAVAADDASCSRRANSSAISFSTVSNVVTIRRSSTDTGDTLDGTFNDCNWGASGDCHCALCSSVNCSKRPTSTIGGRLPCTALMQVTGSKIVERRANEVSKKIF